MYRKAFADPSIWLLWGLVELAKEEFGYRNLEKGYEFPFLENLRKSIIELALRYEN